MAAAKFILLWGFLFNDGHTVNHVDTLQTKEYCITKAHVRWGEFYHNDMDTVSTFTAICRNKENNYDFVKIICDRNGSCNL